MYRVALWSLTGLFVARVAGQLLQRWHEVSWLPPFDSWQGSRLPYGWLFAAQVAIIVIMARLNFIYSSASVPRRLSRGRLFLALGSVYFVTMLGRWIVGMMNLSDAVWFHRHIPTLFHVVLASYILLLGAYHMNWNVTKSIQQRQQ
ncbi:MAG: hypothetical protein IDH49_13430 [Gammaproteobacteria bacterium]|nr:hypothetical protein [Gammaproteobacteria bacterium]